MHDRQSHWQEAAIIVLSSQCRIQQFKDKDRTGSSHHEQRRFYKDCTHTHTHAARTMTAEQAFAEVLEQAFARIQEQARRRWQENQRRLQKRLRRSRWVRNDEEGSEELKVESAISQELKVKKAISQEVIP